MKAVAESYMYDWRPPHIWGNICAFPQILGSPSPYRTLQLFHSEFPYLWGKVFFLFYQCTVQYIKYKYTLYLQIWLELLAVNAKVATVLGLIPASADTVESERRPMKQCWITYIKRKNPKNPPLKEVQMKSKNTVKLLKKLRSKKHIHII